MTNKWLFYTSIHPVQFLFTFISVFTCFYNVDSHKKIRLDIVIDGFYILILYNFLSIQTSSIMFSPHTSLEICLIIPHSGKIIYIFIIFRFYVAANVFLLYNIKRGHTCRSDLLLLKEIRTKSIAGDRYIPLPDFVFDKISHIKGNIIPFALSSFRPFY